MKIKDGIVVTEKKPITCDGYAWRSCDRTCLSVFGCMKI